jgi:hypothetical protein
LLELYQQGRLVTTDVQTTSCRNGNLQSSK